MADDGALEFDDLDDVFQSATKYVRQISGKLETEKLLYFYGRYKQVMSNLHFIQSSNVTLKNSMDGFNAH